jgi:hypothetical protein
MVNATGILASVFLRCDVTDDVVHRPKPDMRFAAASTEVHRRCDESRRTPIPDYDHLPEGALAHRIRSLPAESLRRLLDYEQAHGNRLPVVQLLEQRMHALQSGQAMPSPGDPGARQPEHAPPPDGGSPGNPAMSPVNNQPLRHGVAAQIPNRNIRAR